LQDEQIAIAVADPSQLLSFDEIGLLLGKRIVVHVAALTQITKILNTANEIPTSIADRSPDSKQKRLCEFSLCRVCA